MKHLLFFLSLGVLIVSFSLPVSAGENDNPLTLLSPVGGEQIVIGSVYHVEYMAPGGDCVCVETSYVEGLLGSVIVNATKQMLKLAPSNGMFPIRHSRSAVCELLTFPVRAHLTLLLLFQF